MPSPLDDRIRSVLDRMRVTLSGQLEADLTASAADIITTVADEHRQALAEATERTAAETRREAEQQLSVVRGEFEREKEALERHWETVQREAASEIAGLERMLGDVRDELQAARQQLNDAQSAREVVERELDQVRQNEEDSKRELQQAIERVQHESERARFESDATVRELENARTQLAQATRVASAFRTLDEATSLGDILEGLAQSACQETGRTAVFLVNGEKLRAWRALGFEAGNPVVGSDLQSGEAGVVGQAARLGTGQQHRNGDDSLLPAFAATHGPRDAVALPVQVGGSVIAVLYADAARADRPEEPAWLDLIDRLTKHAGRALEAMTVRQAAALWTPRSAVKRPARDDEGSSAGVA